VRRHWKSQRMWPMLLVKCIAISLLAAAALGGCGGLPSTSTPATTASLPSPIASTSSPPGASRTVQPTSAPSASWTPTATPRGNYPLGFERWPSGGNLLPAMEIEVHFEMSLSDLAPGDYVLFAHPSSEAIQYSSLESSERGVLLSGLDQDRVGYLFKGFGGSWVSAQKADSPQERTTRHIFDLREPRAWRLGPLCDGWESFSPQGRWLTIRCLEEDTATLELVSVEEGVGYRFQVPAERMPGLVWLDEDRFVLSFVSIEGSQRPCIVHILDQRLVCPTRLIDTEVLSVSPNGSLVVFREHSSRTSLGDVSIATIGCLLGEGDCERTILGRGGFGWWAPDSMRTIVDVGDGHQSEFFVHEAPEWASATRVGQYPGIYFYVDWCPDSTCIVIQKNEGATYLLGLDGTTTRLPYDNALGVVRVP